MNLSTEEKVLMIMALNVHKAHLESKINEKGALTTSEKVEWKEQLTKNIELKDRLYNSF